MQQYAVAHTDSLEHSLKSRPAIDRFMTAALVIPLHWLGFRRKKPTQRAFDESCYVKVPVNEPVVNAKIHIVAAVRLAMGSADFYDELPYSELVSMHRNDKFRDLFEEAEQGNQEIIMRQQDFLLTKSSDFIELDEKVWKALFEQHSEGFHAVLSQTSEAWKVMEAPVPKPVVSASSPDLAPEPATSLLRPVAARNIVHPDHDDNEDYEEQESKCPRLLESM